MTVSARFADYLPAFQGLMPRGFAWSRDPASTQGKTLGALAQTWIRSDQASQQLLVDAFPPTANAMLPEWDAALALPEPSAGDPPNLAAHQAHVAARFADGGGQSAAYYTAWAAQFGIAVTVRAYAPFRAGHSHAGEPCAGESWIHALAVDVPNSGSYATWDLAMLSADLQARAPAHGLLTVTHS